MKKSQNVYYCENLWTIWGTEEWVDNYKIGVNVEKSSNHFKESLYVSGQKTQNDKTPHRTLLAGIAQLITFIDADKIHKHLYIRSLKSMNS